MGTLLSLILGSIVGIAAQFMTPGAQKMGPFTSGVFLTFMGGVIGALATESPVFDLTWPSFCGMVVGGLFALVLGVRAYAPAPSAARVRRVSVI
jgi:uncharacterized membrane protein YeaQ/YmgE (transglycosylase-associated protein family)